MLQAESAVDEEVRAAMLRIAEDEARHAELSWDVAAWLELHLDEAARKRVADARRSAVTDLARDVAVAPPRRVAETLGLPTAPQAAQLLEELRQQLWS
jgi:rubrerythrin